MCIYWNIKDKTVQKMFGGKSMMTSTILQSQN